MRITENSIQSLQEAIRQEQLRILESGEMVDETILKLQDGRTGYFYHISIIAISDPSDFKGIEGKIYGVEFDTRSGKTFLIEDIDMVEVTCSVIEKR